LLDVALMNPSKPFKYSWMQEKQFSWTYSSSGLESALLWGKSTNGLISGVDAFGWLEAM